MIKRAASIAIGLVLLVSAGGMSLAWSVCRIYVPENMCAVLIRKMGEPLPPGQLVATEKGQLGIREEVLGPGRYFRNPIWWDWKIHPLTVIPAGDPGTWEWQSSLDEKQLNQVRAGTFQFKGDFPKIGVVSRKIGKEQARGETIVTRESGKKGILKEVLTPGTYKINPLIYKVKIHPAVVIPAGFVGVVTNLFGNQQALETTTASGSQALVNPGERGTLRDVLQPGIYFINPKLQKVTLIEIGFNEYSQIKLSEENNFRIAFPSDTGFLIRVGVTVVWGIDPMHAAEIVNQFGNTDGVLDKVIGPQLRSICRNIGSTYAARDFIHGEKREQFQRALTEELQRVCRSKNIEVLLALVREIEVHTPTAGLEGGEVADDLKRTIQQSYIAIENRITKEKQREAASVKAQLEEVKKQVGIAQETVTADTRVQVANIQAEGDKKAAEIEAQAALEVATVQQEVAQLDAQRIRILGQANADVDRMKNDAEAQGYRLLIEAFGSAKAFNLYTFAQKFQPESIRLFFAGDGTFWTDLSRFEEVGAATFLQSNEQQPDPNAQSSPKPE